MSRHIYHGSKQKITEREVSNNTRDTHKASKLEDVGVHTKNCMKNLGFLKKIILRYSYTPIKNLELKEQYIDNYSVKFSHDFNNSWLYAMINNVCLNVGYNYITEKDLVVFRGWLHNMGIQMRRGGNNFFSGACLCYWFMEKFPKRRIGSNRLQCFKIDAITQTNELVQLLNRGYVLCQCRIATNEIPDELIKNCEIAHTQTQQSGNIEKVYGNQKNGFDSTHFTNIYYDKQLRAIKEISGFGKTSMGTEITCTVKDWIRLIKEGCIRSELCLVSQNIE